MTPSLSWVEFSSASSVGLPLLVVGPSLGTSVTTLWGQCATELSDDFRVVGWQLPGHAGAGSATGFTLADLAAGVLAFVDSMPSEGQDTASRSFFYAGDSVGGAVGLQLLIDAPERVTAAAVICTAARIGDPSSWADRASVVRGGGTSVLLAATPARWFGIEFADRSPDTASRLLQDLAGVDAESYAAACEALAEFDVRDRLCQISTPLLAIAGAEDVTAPPARLRHIADGVQHGTLEILDGVAHLAPAEAPDRVASLIRGLTHRRADPSRDDRTVRQVRAEGMRVRREVLGDEHVDRAAAAVTDFTADFQALISQYAWDTVWSRPGLDRRSRSLVTLTALVARGHHEELAMHVRAARNNGVTEAELAELFLQTAIYCGVPDANTAFRIAQRVFAERRSTADTDSPTVAPPQDQRW